MNDLRTIQIVAEVLRARFHVNATVEYPGFLAIPSADTHVWAVGPDDDEHWTGQLMSEDGSTNVRDLCFRVRPTSDREEDIATAIYANIHPTPSKGAFDV
jgi:hypothetical protein